MAAHTDPVCGQRGIVLPEEFERWFRVGAFTFRGVRDFFRKEKLGAGVGADVVFYHNPSELGPIYGMLVSLSMSWFIIQRSSSTLSQRRCLAC